VAFSIQLNLIEVVVVTGELINLKVRLLAGMCRSTVTLEALLNVPSICPNCADPVASDLNVTSFPPKSAVPVEAIDKVLPALTVKVLVPLIVREPPASKSIFNRGVPEFIRISVDASGKVPVDQFPAVFQRLSPANPVHTNPDVKSISSEDVQRALVIVQRNVYEELADPVKVDIGFVGSVIVPPVPLTMLHNPVPTVGALPASVAEMIPPDETTF
jgi:hypothetical protein